jgi:SAM-dependent methyltransferase
VLDPEGRWREAVADGFIQWAMSGPKRKVGGRGEAAALQREVARSLDSPPAALPHLAELLADLRVLGTTPRRVVNWLAAAGVGAGSEVVDLGCGKGAASVEAAARLGCRVLGIDAFAPFIEEAESSARRRGVKNLCRFEAGDYRRALRTLVRKRTKFDAGLMLSVAPVEVAAESLRKVVRTGGVYVIDDAVWVGRDDSDEAPRANEVREYFQWLGDEVVREHVLSSAEVMRMEAKSQARIAARARGIGRRHPKMRTVLKEMLATQRQSVESLTNGPLRPALWLVRRGKGR